MATKRDQEQVSSTQGNRQTWELMPGSLHIPPSDGPERIMKDGAEKSCRRKTGFKASMNSPRQERPTGSLPLQANAPRSENNSTSVIFATAARSPLCLISDMHVVEPPGTLSVDELETCAKQWAGCVPGGVRTA